MITNPPKKERPVSSGPNQSSNAGVNIDEFTYSNEAARSEFLININLLHDIGAEFYSLIKEAEDKDKSGVFLSVKMLEVFKENLNQTASRLQLNYELLNNTLKITNKLYKACSKIHLKDLAHE